jgi:hypothetical protein
MFYVYNKTTGLYAKTITHTGGVCKGRVQPLPFDIAAPECVESHTSESAARNAVIVLNEHSVANGLPDRYAYQKG